MNLTTQNELEDIENDIKNISHTLTATADNSPDMTLLLVRIGKAHNKRFNIRHELDDNLRAIENWTKALTLTPANHIVMPDLLDSLGTAHGQRFQRLGEMKDINQGIEYACLALALTPDGHQGLPRQLGNLGLYHRERFRRMGKLEDLEQAMKYDCRAITVTPNDHPQFPKALASLGMSYGARFQRLGEPEDLDKSIQYQTRALNFTPDGHQSLSSMLTNIGSSHGYRFQHIGELDDLEKAIQYQSRAVDLTPDNDPSLASMLANLGTSHSNRFRRLDELMDLEKSIQYQTRALDLTPDGHPYLSNWLANLGISYTYRFERLGELADVEMAIQYQSRAIDLIPSGHPTLPIWLANLGTSHGHRFKRLGKLADLEKAIQYQSRALDLTPDGHPDLSRRLDTLGSSHGNRFQRIGELTDLEKAIQFQSRALDLTPDGHSDLSIRLANLGTSHSYRFDRLGELADLEKDIHYQSRALGLITDDNPEFSRRLAGLGSSHCTRFERLGELADLEKAIQCQSRALDLTPNGHPELPRRLTNLVKSIGQRFYHLGESADLEKLSQHQSRAVAFTQDGHPHLAWIYYNSALINFLHYQCTNDPSHLNLSLNFFRLVTQSIASSPRDRFRFANGWTRFASKHSALGLIEAYQATIDILPQFIWLGATTTQRYEDLPMAETLAVDAAHAAILSSDPSLALEWLEHARCVVWTQHLMLRSPLDQLQSSHPILASRLQTVATQLHSVSSDTRESRALAFDSKNVEEVGREHRRLAQEYEELLDQIRKLIGFEDFLRPMKAKSLVCAARSGPIAVINCHANRCDALIIRPGQDHVDHVPLPNFNRNQAMCVRFDMELAVRSAKVRERGVERRPLVEIEDISNFRTVLSVLWYNIVKPILEFLGYMNDVSMDSLPHITWCPTGPISFLPLHAAGDYDQVQSRVFNYVISSYTPTLTALLEITPGSLRSDSRMLAIGQAATPGHSPLPGTTKEIMQLEAHTRNKFKYSQLINDQATKGAVLEAMEQHDWIHLACHAHQNVVDPTKSGFFLHDDILDLASINRRSFKNKGLAFLSACQTATGDAKLPDEAVHLASGMLMAGYTSVIATMWSVVDADAPLIADRVYSQLMDKGELGNGEAGKALHNAVAVLREEVGEQEFERWVPYIHVGS